METIKSQFPNKTNTSNLLLEVVESAFSIETNLDSNGFLMGIIFLAELGLGLKKAARPIGGGGGEATH